MLIICISQLAIYIQESSQCACSHDILPNTIPVYQRIILVYWILISPYPKFTCCTKAVSPCTKVLSLCTKALSLWTKVFSYNTWRVSHKDSMVYQVYQKIILRSICILLTKKRTLIRSCAFLMEMSCKVLYTSDREIALFSDICAPVLSPFEAICKPERWISWSLSSLIHKESSFFRHYSDPYSCHPSYPHLSPHL